MHLLNSCGHDQRQLMIKDGADPSVGLKSDRISWLDRALESQDNQLNTKILYLYSLFSRLRLNLLP